MKLTQLAMAVALSLHIAAAQAATPTTKPIFDCTWGTSSHPKPTGLKVIPALWATAMYYRSSTGVPTIDSITAFVHAYVRGVTSWPTWSGPKNLSGKRLLVLDVEGQAGGSATT